ncbi:acyl-CoA thioesterase [Nocardioides dongxiaopingii]|uniref:acyl-CoA thioesterase n=1 Tax=Nocardioides dongxiaopingii TaxID=2576036 RepID=UPI0010C76CB6|nr:acyl-CoA thioesterase domain-containing protein [Nocardioides dongxiaopingii]
MSFAPPFTAADAEPDGGALLDALRLETVDRDLYRATFVVPDDRSLYGGQVAAQALRAAGLTVEPDRLPHSLHGYFLRAGDSEHPTLFRVHRDRDGRSFSARRVEAVQHGKVIFSMAASFHLPDDGPEVQVRPAPEVAAPEESPAVGLPRLLSFEARAVDQPHPDTPWPTRFWARTTAPLDDDPLLHAAVLTYLSDISSGIAPLTRDGATPGASLDHALWFHHPARADAWLLTDLEPHVAGRGRGWYTGTFHDRTGRAVASTTQECLFRAAR